MSDTPGKEPMLNVKDKPLLINDFADVTEGFTDSTGGSEAAPFDYEAAPFDYEAAPEKEEPKYAFKWKLNNGITVTFIVDGDVLNVEAVESMKHQGDVTRIIAFKKKGHELLEDGLCAWFEGEKANMNSLKSSDAKPKNNKNGGK